jgi:hypothetical protein
MFRTSLSLHPFNSFCFHLPNTFKILITAKQLLHAEGFCINAVWAAWAVATWHTYYGIWLQRSKIRNSVPVLSAYGQSCNPGCSYCRKQHTLPYLCVNSRKVMFRSALLPSPFSDKNTTPHGSTAIFQAVSQTIKLIMCTLIAIRICRDYPVDHGMSSFRRNVNETCAILWFYATWSGNSAPRSHLQVPWSHFS